MEFTATLWKLRKNVTTIRSHVPPLCLLTETWTDYWDNKIDEFKIAEEAFNGHTWSLIQSDCLAEIEEFYQENGDGSIVIEKLK